MDRASLIFLYLKIKGVAYVIGLTLCFQIWGLNDRN